MTWLEFYVTYRSLKHLADVVIDRKYLSNIYILTQHHLAQTKQISEEIFALLAFTYVEQFATAGTTAQRRDWFGVDRVVESFIFKKLASTCTPLAGNIRLSDRHPCARRVWQVQTDWLHLGMHPGEMLCLVILIIGAVVERTVKGIALSTRKIYTFDFDCAYECVWFACFLFCSLLLSLSPGKIFQNTRALKNMSRMYVRGH